MRAAPIGLFFFDDPERLIRAAQAQGRITHQDERCSAGALAVAGAVALALQNEVIRVPDFLSRLSNWTATLESSLAVGIQHLVDWVPLPPENAANLICRFGLDPGSPEGWEGVSPFVTPSVLWSLYSFLKTPDDYWETIRSAIAVGGDVDTTAAMAGAISGAYLGLEVLPLDLAQRLTDRGTWGFDDLVDLADRAYAVKMRLAHTM